MVTTGNRSAPAPSVISRRRSLPSALVLCSSAVFGLQIGVARLGYGLALPAIRHSLQGSYALYGAINAASLGGYLAGALLAPLLIRRVHPLVLASSAVAGAALAASAFASSPLAFGVARTVFGVASGVALVAAAVQTLESVEAARRGGASAVMWAGIGVGLALSALGSSWLLRAALDWRIASFVAGALTLAAGIGYDAVTRRVAARVVPSSAAQTSSLSARFDYRDLLRPRRFLFLCLSYGAFGFAYIAYATFIVASLDARLAPRGASATIEHLWGLYGLTSVIGALAVGRLLEGPLGRGAMAFAGLAGAAGCVAVFVSLQAAVPSAILVGLGLTATPAAATALARARTTPAGAPVAIAAVTVAVGIGQLIGPLAAGIAADRFGLNSVALVAGCAYLLGTVLAAVDAFAAREAAA